MTEFHPCSDSQVMSATSEACVSQSFLAAEVPLNFAPKIEPLVSSGHQAVFRDTFDCRNCTKLVHRANLEGPRVRTK